MRRHRKVLLSEQLQRLCMPCGGVIHKEDVRIKGSDGRGRLTTQSPCCSRRLLRHAPRLQGETLLTELLTGLLEHIGQ